MKIIIPMAGDSKRFKEAGYDVPKPFIMIDDKTMIERACRMFSPSDEFIFICNKGHLQNKDYLKILEGAVLHSKIVPIDSHNYGPVYSVLQAKRYIPEKEEPIIISYCDFTMQWNYRQFLLKAEHYEGAIPVFRGFHPASLGETYYAYLQADENLEMIELREKRSFTDSRMEEFASSGVYYLESWKTFEHYAEELMNKNTTVGREYYCSLLFNPMVQDGKRISLFEVEKFICWGTPGDLEEYLFWSDYFSRDAEGILATEFKGD